MLLELIERSQLLFFIKRTLFVTSNTKEKCRARTTKQLQLAEPDVFAVCIKQAG